MGSSATVRTARHRTFRIAAAALTAAAGLALTACSGADAAGTKAGGRPDTGVADADPGGGGSSAAGQGSGSEADGQVGTKTEVPGAAGEKSARSGAGGGSKAGGSGGRRCHTSDLKAAFALGEDAAPDPNAGGGTITSIVLTNKSNRTCTIGGFAGVDLRPDAGGPSWSLARSSAKHGT
ncbi:flagellar motor protein MotB, partial [Streptomyces griseoflavus]